MTLSLGCLSLRVSAFALSNHRIGRWQPSRCNRAVGVLADMSAADLERTRAELEEQNRALVAEIQQLNSGLAADGHDVSASPGTRGLADALALGDYEPWSVCNEDELELLRRITDAISTHDAAAATALRTEMERRLQELRAQEDVYSELCQDLLTEAQQVQKLCNAIGEG